MAFSPFPAAQITGAYNNDDQDQNCTINYSLGMFLAKVAYRLAVKCILSINVEQYWIYPP